MDVYQRLTIDKAEAQSDVAGESGRVFCANCIHSKLVPSPA